MASWNVAGSHSISRGHRDEPAGERSDQSSSDAGGHVGAVLGLAALDRAAEAAETPVAAKGRIKQSIVHWCFATTGTSRQMIKVAKGLGCGSIELIDPKYFPLLKEHGLECAIGTIDMSPGPAVRAGVQQPQAPRAGDPGHARRHRRLRGVRIQERDRLHRHARGHPRRRRGRELRRGLQEGRRPRGGEGGHALPGDAQQRATPRTR